MVAVEGCGPELGGGGQVSITGRGNSQCADQARSYERPRLNERPIYLRSTFLILALLQSVLHLYRDYDRVALPVSKSNQAELSDKQPHRTEPPLTQLKTRLLRLLHHTGLKALSVLLIGPIIYAIFVRQIAWNWSLFFAKMLWNLSRDTALPRYPPYRIDVMWRVFYSSFLLIFLWEFTNATFAAYVGQEPLKNGNPLTSDSRDPNGSLLTGLKAKKEVPRVILHLSP